MGGSRWVGGFAAVAAMTLALVGGGCSGHHCGDPGVECATNQPALQAVVTPIPEPSNATCLRIMSRQRDASPDQDRATCAEGRGRLWYRAIVINNGHDSAQPQCSVRAYNAHGFVFKNKLDVGLVHYPFGPVVPADHRYSFTGYFADQRAKAMDAYEAACVNLSPDVG